MDTSPVNIQPKCTHWLLCVLTGIMVATAAIVLLGAKSVGAVQLAKWQMVLIYVALVSATLWLGRKDCARQSRAE